jgi:RND family efflux transporter MFP subunit
MKRFAAFLAMISLVCLAIPSRSLADRVGASPVSQQAGAAEADDKKDEPAEKAEADDKKEGEKAADKSASNGEAKEEKAAEADDDSADATNKAKEEEDKKSAGEASDKADPKKATKKRKTHEVDTKRLKVDVALDGTFVATEMTEVALRPEAWSDYEIVEVAELGEKVRAGEVLFKFDSRKLNEAIADLELEQRINEIAIRKSEEELPRLEQTLTLDLGEAERSSKEAKEDFERYTEIERPMIVKSAEFTAKYYQSMLDYEKDELDQLEKMYEADDLTEETEEIVLKRQKNSVEFAEFSLESAKLNRDETLNVRLPRFDIQMKEALERTELALARAKMAFNLDLNAARYELEQRKEARTKSLDRHAKLVHDRGLMEIKSPVDGVVYYGKCVNGRFAETSTLLNKYEPKSNVTPGTVLVTIVDPRPLSVTATFDEAKRPDLAVGQKARILPPAEGSERVDGKVKEISPIPVSPGKFEIQFEVADDELPEWIVAGMSCKLKVNVYDEADALTVPKAAVHTDKEDEDQHYVWVVDPDDEEAKAERRTVEVGRRSGDDVEIIKGLKKGEVISLDDESDKAEKEADAQD